MPGWYKPDVTKVTMEKFDHPELYVVFANFDGRAFGEAVNFVKEYSQFQSDGSSVDPELFNKLAQDIVENIVEWGIPTHPVTGETLEKPTTVGDLRSLPFAIVMEIASGLTTTDEIPKETSTEPEQPS